MTTAAAAVSAKLCEGDTELGCTIGMEPGPTPGELPDEAITLASSDMVVALLAVQASNKHTEPRDGKANDDWSTSVLSSAVICDNSVIALDEALDGITCDSLLFELR